VSLFRELEPARFINLIKDLRVSRKNSYRKIPIPDVKRSQERQSFINFCCAKGKFLNNMTRAWCLVSKAPSVCNWAYLCSATSSNSRIPIGLGSVWDFFLGTDRGLLLSGADDTTCRTSLKDPNALLFEGGS
jgi:hypothetical protein